jgi:hypothetical protein
VAELNAEGFSAEAIAGGKGQFDIVVDGDVVFSKHELGRFPENGEILGLLEA